MAVVKEDGRERVIPKTERDKRIRLFLVRHGQVEGHDRFAFHGHHDVELTELGRKQLDTAAEYLAGEKIDEIYSSDLRRSMYGAGAIARGRGIEPVALPALREMNFGILEGRSSLEVMKEFGEVFRAWREDILNCRLPEGECLADVAQRVGAALDTILGKGGGRTIALVAHGGVNRIILTRALVMDPAHAFRIEQDYGCLNVIDYYPDWTVVKMVNRTLP